MSNFEVPEQFRAKHLEQQITVTKLEAAKRQLDTAVDLWFSEADPVSILSLAYSSYEIIHRLFRRRGFEDDLVFDNTGIPENHRKEWNIKLKHAPNFIKHANRGEVDEKTTFYVAQNDVFMIFSIIALQRMGAALSPTHKAFMGCAMLNYPTRDMLDKLREQGFDIEKIPQLQALGRPQFLKMYLEHLKENG